VNPSCRRFGARRFSSARSARADCGQSRSRVSFSVTFVPSSASSSLGVPEKPSSATIRTAGPIALASTATSCAAPRLPA